MTPNPSSPPVAAEPSAMPIVALVLAILGLCLPPLLLVALILAIVSLAKSGEPAYAARKGLAIAALVVPVALLPVVGVLAAIAIPNFIKFQARAKQSECKVNLKAAFVGQKSLYGERNTYSPLIKDVGFLPERGNRYAYYFEVRGAFLEPGSTPTGKEVGILPDRQRYPGLDVDRYAAAVPPDALPGVEGQCPDCNFTVVCVGNVDSDATLDVWSVSNVDRTSPLGEAVPAGMPLNHVNDVTD
ncbi:MAG: pilin [Myxococcota bacterium]